MKYQISCIGKASNTPEQSLINKYLKRLHNKIIIKEISQKNDFFNKLDEQDEKLLKLAPKNSFLIVLDRDGINFTSENLAQTIKNCESKNFRIINFVIGGSFGHGKNIKKKANKILSFGKLTWSHLLARTMIIEQLYRVECIFNNHPYHK